MGVRSGVSLLEVLVAAGLSLLVFVLAFTLWRGAWSSNTRSRLDPGLADDLQFALAKLREDFRLSEFFAIGSGSLSLSRLRPEAGAMPTLATITWTWDTVSLTRTAPEGSRRFGPGPNTPTDLRLEVILTPAASGTVDLFFTCRDGQGQERLQIREKMFGGTLPSSTTSHRPAREAAP